MAVAEYDGVKMNAVTWSDSKVCTVLSTADGTNRVALKRQIGPKVLAFQVPKSIQMYTKFMGGVDVFDRYLSRFSMVKGHSFKKWYKKLGLAVVHDLTLNAFFTRRLAHEVTSAKESKERDIHLAFMGELIADLFHTDWEQYSDCSVLLFNDLEPTIWQTAEQLLSPRVKNQRSLAAASQILMDCSPHASHFKHDSSSRCCRVCDYELRPACRKTQFCPTHQISLCTRAYPAWPVMPFTANLSAETCWSKFHRFYLPQGIFLKTSKNWNKSSKHPFVLDRKCFLNAFLEDADIELINMQKDNKPAYWASQERKNVIMKKAHAFLESNKVIEV